MRISLFCISMTFDFITPYTMKIWAGVFDELYLSLCKAIYDISYTRWDNSKEDNHIHTFWYLLNVPNMNIKFIFSFVPIYNAV